MDNSTTLPASIFSAYTPLTDTFDEMSAAADMPRSHWQYLVQALASLGTSELQNRYQEIRRLLRDNGVAYNAYSDPQQAQRPWLLDPIPLLLASDEWRSIERGLQQRAELFRRLLLDLYGPCDAIKQGILPPELVYSHPGFLRPGVSVLSRQNAINPVLSRQNAINPVLSRQNAFKRIDKTPDTPVLPLYAADLARAPDGGIYVIGDRSQAPPGAGYALENRMVMARVFPSLFRDCQVHRLALYFRTLRASLNRMAVNMRPGDDPRIVVLTPGPSSDTYFEHAYLAKYLGYNLVEGADLTVRDGRVWLKTLDGLQNIDVILRYVEDHLCDPLELRPDSSFGVAGLLHTARLKNIAIANPLGSGIIENPALFAFLPALAKFFLGEDLLLPSPATYWCGSAQSRTYVLKNLPRLLIRSITDKAAKAGIDGRLLSTQQCAELGAQINARPYLFVGQEPGTLSTIPVFEDGVLQPRQMVLRSFLVASESGNDYVALPGGLCRVAADPDAPVDAVQNGGISKDTWVLASEQIQAISLLPSAHQVGLRNARQSELPSRVAENLYWLGRYAERSESVIRLLRQVFLYLLEPYNDYIDNDPGLEKNKKSLHGLLRAVTQMTESYPGFIGTGAGVELRLDKPEEELFSVFLDKTRNGSLSATLSALLFAARSVRDRISPDIWRVFNDIDDGLHLLQQAQQKLSPRSAHELILNSALDELNGLLTTFAAFTGLAIDSMTHGQGWRFLMLGRRLERALQTSQLLYATLSDSHNNDNRLLEYILNVCDSLMTYRSRYQSQFHLQTMLELLLQDESNPRAVAYQLKHLQSDIHALPGMRDDAGYKRPEKRLILGTLNQLRLADSEQLIRLRGGSRSKLLRFLQHLSEQMRELSDAISYSYFSHAEQPRQLNKVREYIL